MSFSSDVKNEILSVLSTEKQPQICFLSALIRSSGEFGLGKNGITIEITTKLNSLKATVDDILTKIYGTTCTQQAEEDSFLKCTKYTLIIDCPQTNQILIDCGIGKINEESQFEFITGISENLFTSDECYKAYLQGMIVGCGSVSGLNEGKRRSIDYHIEWTLSDEDAAQGLMEILARFDLFAHKVLRKKVHVLYLQRFEQISDLLVIVGASSSMLVLNDAYAMRSIKNTVNRVTNCETANLNKTINASLAQLDAIEVILNTIGLDALPDDLNHVCVLRLANHEESLGELARLSGMTKSALSYRLNRIIKIANEIKEDI